MELLPEVSMQRCVALEMSWYVASLSREFLRQGKERSSSVHQSAQLWFTTTDPSGGGGWEGCCGGTLTGHSLAAPLLLC